MLLAAYIEIHWDLPTWFGITSVGVLGGGLISHRFQTAHENVIIRFRNCLYKG
jgi:hypothetical protein